MENPCGFGKITTLDGCGVVLEYILTFIRMDSGNGFM
jgi:hypothetical protein